MNLQLQGRTAIVTGSSRGIGLAIARALHAEGCQVMLNGRDERVLAAARQSFGDKAAHFAGDVTLPDVSRGLVRATTEQWGGVDILVCNVGNGSSAKPGEETGEDWRRMIEINFMSAVEPIKAATEDLSRTKGSILCVSSICGEEVVPGAPVTYSAAKAALNAYVRGMARPLAKQGIRINALAPGNIIFEGSVWDRKLRENRAQTEEYLRQEVALGRLGKPEEVAAYATFLVSPLASFATGSVHTVDGGQVR